MGGIGRALFGGSKSKSTSDNKAFGTLNNALAAPLASLGSSFGAIGDFLGLNGAGGDAKSALGLENFLNSTGGKFMLDQGSKAITGNNAARGLLASGATGKALTEYGQNLAATQSQNYLGNLQALAQLGLGSANTLAGAGQQSISKGSTSGGIVPALFPKGLSDRRLKTAIRKIGEFADGLAIYTWRYLWGQEATGVMADEVAAKRPWAVGPKFAGYATVNYSAL